MDSVFPGEADSASLDILEFMDMKNASGDDCYSTKSTVLRGLPFGGVPTVLGINVLLWLFLLLVFSCLRKAAWDYGRLALLMDNDSLTSLFYGEQSEKEKSPSESSPLDVENKDVGFCSWLLSIFQMKDEELQSKCGVDATTYLSFQRHILVLLMIICVLSVAVILPINFAGDPRGQMQSQFGRTTIANIHSQDRLLWLHSFFSLLYFIITFLCMAHHSAYLGDKDPQKAAKTLMVTHIPKEISDPSLILKHFHEAFPSCTVTNVQFCFDVRKLMKLDALRRKAMKGRLYFTTKTQKEGKIMIKTHPCARIFCCRFCGFEEVDAEQYYSELEEKLTDEFNAERNRIELKRLTTAFVTFQDERMTSVILKDYSKSRCRNFPQQSSVTTVVKSYRWGVSYAPDPSDIIWENLSVSSAVWWARFVLLNISLFLLLFFLTTPAIIVNTMDMFNVTRPVEQLKNPIITQFFPTLLLWAFSVFLPFIVYYSAFFESHWTRSYQNRVTMHKCYFFQVFMVIILPSLGLTSLDVFFRWLFDINFLKEARIKFQCVFLPDNGAFFVNYVITASLTGTAMELLRIPALLVYAARLCLANSEPERLHIRRSQAYEFQFGLQYAWTSCIFSVVMTYSIICPIIVPFGLLYMLLKHLVDRYNIYYVFIPTKLSPHIHRAAISQVIVAPILCMFWLLFFSVVRLGTVRPVTLFTFVVLLSCIIISFFGLFLKQLQPRKPSSYQPLPLQLSEQSEGVFNDTERSSVSSTPNSNQVFVATVLQEPEMSLTPATSPAHQSYGTMGSQLEALEGGEEKEEEEEEEENGLQSLETELEGAQKDFQEGAERESQARYH
ncbi:calcium permeable stress-gated cation channel 1 isoform X1 [Ornithorhynchus anatinus]|uniref:calcium permeable stress-gated cation channel 1 isoform X1 n=2 Tax=Ornithorhynchus anatinus TaxID=9258 RepID=UPI0010A93789|nr:calcium permeable stress-gated cation channel 1 isoform X1 [Ornithorhynchus anatinus]XP_028930511.1 calcium permeable stress-gated cation channel 1 isoform X1 [Ornithorhynchus anatinus]XP_028930518.1 calcium permeable stress-gated cation channel 1 isoform X1 [Ornithorhynchus anatinus]XP_028930527.1 calcium permeable stress-gated cation channel 1 isoform X1 [Ornithorhynchus anatinus]XP_028930554.1 calcium permeable stress-gated cation channel 1 isoform X1 [Ornithorhynchus anatinus]XP_0289305